jgi:long-chain acyl-CoA synthetase
MKHETLGGMFLHRIQESPNDIAVRHKDGGDTYIDVSWKQLGERMERIASGLLTAVKDLPHHAPIAILGNTSNDWIACDFAALSVSLRTVPVYATLLPSEVGYLHVDTEAVIAIVEDGSQLAKVREIRSGFTFFEKEYAADQMKLQHIVVMDPTGIEAADDWESLADLEKRGAERLEETKEDRSTRAAGLSRSETATYTYTSGTTGPPKGVIQTSGNMLCMLESAEECGVINADMKDGGLFLFLPLAHSFGRLIELSGPYFNAPIVIAGIPTLKSDLIASRPGFFPSAPRVYEKFKARIESGVAGAPLPKRLLVTWAISTGLKSVPFKVKNQQMPWLLQKQYNLAEKLVFKKLATGLGLDRCSILLSGSAPLSVEVHSFFLGMGFTLLEAYGLTETCPGLTSNLPDRMKLGTVGPAFPGIQIKIASDGEILAKGDNITSGYLNRPESTEAAFDDEGWFHTGDLGSMDSEGFVKITGRKKELMKTSGGKYIAPAKLEAYLKNLTIVQEAVTVADTRNFATALIAIDPEELEEWAKQTGNAADPKSTAVRAAVQAHVEMTNKKLASYETIKYFEIVPPMTVESGLLTASLKVKRKVVHDRYADLIDSMYQKKK